jgi:hypothetical protein
LAVYGYYFSGRSRSGGSRKRVRCKKRPLPQIRAANLSDELKTAFWFIHNPRPSAWVDAQIRRAARNARNLNLDSLYPRQMPRTFYIAAGMIVLFVSLNFVPLPWNHNWLTLQAAPAFALTDKEEAILKQTEELLRKAEKLKKSELAAQVEDIVEQLKEGKIDAPASCADVGSNPKPARGRKPRHRQHQ